MSTISADATTELRVDARRARFREAVGGLSTRARSGDLLRMLLLPASTLVVVGFGLMILGWWGAAHTHREIEQIPYLISGGLLGLALVILGGLLLVTAVWLSSMERMRTQSDERGRQHLAELLAAMPQPPVAPAAAPVKKRPIKAKAAG